MDGRKLASGPASLEPNALHERCIGDDIPNAACEDGALGERPDSISVKEPTLAGGMLHSLGAGLSGREECRDGGALLVNPTENSSMGIRGAPAQAATLSVGDANGLTLDGPSTVEFDRLIWGVRSPMGQAAAGQAAAPNCATRGGSSNVVPRPPIESFTRFVASSCKSLWARRPTLRVGRFSVAAGTVREATSFLAKDGGTDTSKPHCALGCAGATGTLVVTGTLAIVA